MPRRTPWTTTVDAAHRVDFRCLHCGEPVMPPAVCACTLSPAQRWERRVAFLVTLGLGLGGVATCYALVRVLVALWKGLSGSICS